MPYGIIWEEAEEEGLLEDEEWERFFFATLGTLCHIGNIFHQPAPWNSRGFIFKVHDSIGK
jgi:hypothetical protein